MGIDNVCFEFVLSSSCPHPVVIYLCSQEQAKGHEKNKQKG